MGITEDSIPLGTQSCGAQAKDSAQWVFQNVAAQFSAAIRKPTRKCDGFAEFAAGGGREEVVHVKNLCDGSRSNWRPQQR